MPLRAGEVIKIGSRGPQRRWVVVNPRSLEYYDREEVRARRLARLRGAQKRR